MMTQVMKKHLKKNKKGFTLIEVVVVLVILAILAAIAVPALTGYIDDANKRSVTTEARTALVGLQHLASTDKADNPSITAPGAAGGYFAEAALSDDGKTQIQTLTGVNNIGGKISAISLSGAAIESFTYTGDKYKVDYNTPNFETPYK